MKKKIICISIITLILITVSFFVILNINKKEIIQNKNISENILEESKETKVINNVPEIEQKELTIDVYNVENSTEKQGETEDKKDVKIQTQNGNINISPEINTQNKSCNNNNDTIIQNKQTEIVSRKQEEKKQEAIIQKQEENTENIITQTKEEPKQEIGEKYITNNDMINKIKNIINSNPSEDMKTYGYNVIVDSSIPALTNQFTFSEKRVLDKITYKFGTIRIYSQDYYNNGKYICTQCFII